MVTLRSPRRLSIGRLGRARALPALGLLLGLPLAGGCGAAIPDPRAAVAAYTDAARRGDAAALWELLDDAGRKRISREELERIVSEAKAELSERATVFSSPDARLEARAEVSFADGERAVLMFEQGAFWVSGAEALPSGARSPQQALDQLRRVLARRSYAGLLRMLTPTAKGAIERNMRSLVDGLEGPDGLDIQVEGDRAEVAVPGGHRVRLRREEGVWRIEEFE